VLDWYGEIPAYREGPEKFRAPLGNRGRFWQKAGGSSNWGPGCVPCSQVVCAAPRGRAVTLCGKTGRYLGGEKIVFGSKAAARLLCPAGAPEFVE